MKNILMATLVAAFITSSSVAQTETSGQALDRELSSKADAAELANEATRLQGEIDAANDKITSQDAKIDSVNNGLADNAAVDAAQEGSISANSSAISSLQSLYLSLSTDFQDMLKRIQKLELDVAALISGGVKPPPSVLPSISVSSSATSVQEGGAFEFNIVRSGDISVSSSVSYAAYGSADAADFNGAVISSGVISFHAGESLATLSVSTNDDSVVEADEDFGVSLNSPVNASIGTATAQTVILNNDTAPPPPPITGAVFPDGADGRPIAVLVLGHHHEWQGENPYKNTLLLGGFAPMAKLVDGTANQKTGEICLAANETVTLGFVRPGQSDGVNPDPGKWLLRAYVPVGSTATINAPLFVNDGSAAPLIRKSRTLDDTTLGNDVVSVTGGASGGCITPDFVGPEKYENDPRDDFRPEFERDAGQYHLIRSLDYTTTSGSRVTSTSELLNDDDAVVYSGTNCFKADCYVNRDMPPASGPIVRGGYKFAQLFKLAREADVSLWVNTPPALGMNVIKRDIISCKAATLVPAIAANWAVIEPAMRAEAFAYGVKLARSAKDGGYPDFKALVVEIGNEFWNSGNSAFACTNDVAEGVGLATTGAPSVGEGVGVIAAIHVNEIKRAFAQEKPGQALSFAVGMKTMGYSTWQNTFHNGMVTAFTGYETAHNIAPSNLIDVFAATTGYYSGHSQWNNNRSPGVINNPFGASTEAEFNAGFIAADGDGTLFDKARAYYLGPVSTNTNVAKLVQLHTQWRDWAVSVGMRGVIQYEGSGANSVGSGSTQLGGVYPGAFNAERRWARSQQAFDVQNAIIVGISKINPMNPAVTTGWRPQSMPVSNYQSIGNLSLTTPWKEKWPSEAGTCPTIGTSGAWCANLRH